MCNRWKIVLLLSFFIFGQLFAQKPVYPIIFIHGLNSNDKTWQETVYFMADNYLWGDPYTNKGIFHAVLNSNFGSSLYSDDVIYYDDLSDNNLFCINFDGIYDKNQNKIIPYTDHGIYGQSESNESAIVKQGYALSKMIRKVLQVTGSSKVILVGHSMGGLAAREYLQRREGGVHKWWDEKEGHQVAKLITFGTPHLGSNADLSVFQEFVIDNSSEAVRDLRWNYSYSLFPWANGVYLFGGDEDKVPLLFHEEDVNCDGKVGGWITGINAGSDLTFDNPNMPLPADLEYTWIVSDEGTSVGGDWVVDLDRQWLYDEQKRPVPYGLAEKILTHRAHWNETKDYGSIMKGLDEPDHIYTAYQINIDESYHVFATHQGESQTDTDYFMFSINQSGVYRFRLDNIPGFFTENSISFEIIAEDKTTIRKKQTNTSNRIEFYLTSTELADDTLYIKITYNIPEYQKKSWLYPLTLSVDLIGPPYQLYAYANPSGIEANNIDKTTISAELQDFVGNISLEEGHSVSFDIVQGQDYGILEGQNPVIAENGKASIQLKATALSGKMDIEVSSAGLKSDTITVYSREAGLVTKVKGHITSDTKWTLANSPYEVTEDVIVDQGVVLTIEPGVIIRFRNDTDLVIRGGLIAKGKPSYPIIFTSSGKQLPGSWGGVSFESTAIDGQCILEYCEISYAGDDSWAVSFPIRLNLKANPVIRNTKIYNSRINAVGLVVGDYSSDIRIDNPGLPFWVKDNIRVNQGAVLTIAPGCVFKMKPDADFLVNGGFIARGTADQPIVFTSYKDDRYYGDTNNDGSSDPLPGDWGGVQFNKTAISEQCVLEFCEFYYAGDESWGAGFPIRLNLQANPQIRYTNVYNCRINAVGLVVGDYSSDIRIDNPGLPMWVSDNIRMLQGAVLTIAPGCVFKMKPDADFVVNGGFVARGTAEEPIVFTSYKDDRYYGDTNNDGSSDPLPGDWGGIQINKTAISKQCVLEYCEFYYAGDESWGAGYPIRLNLQANPQIRYTNVYNCRINAVGLVVGDYSSDIRIDNPGLPMWVTDNIRILQGAVLTIAPGCVFKMKPNADFVVNGGFVARGTADQPIVFTSYKDDRYYGDTNNDGSSDPLPGDWGGIQINKTAISEQCVLEYCEFYYAGDESWGAGYPIVCDQKDILIQNIQLMHSRSHGIYIKTNGKPDLGGGSRDSRGNNVFYGYRDNNKFAVYNNSPNDIEAQNNFWTTVDSSAIAESIFDYYDNASKGKVTFTGYQSLPPTQPKLTEPEDNTITAEGNVVFSWEESSDAEGAPVTYALYLSSNSKDTTVYPVEESSIQFDGNGFFQPDSAYNWYVTSSDGENISTSTDTFTLFYHLPTAIGDKSVHQPKHWRLYQNYPNPFNATTRIKYSLAAGGRVQIILYNVLGQKIRTLVNGYQSAGMHELRLNTDALSSGVYFYSIILNKVNKRITRKMVLIK